MGAVSCTGSRGVAGEGLAQLGARAPFSGDVPSAPRSRWGDRGHCVPTVQMFGVPQQG